MVRFLTSDWVHALDRAAAAAGPADPAVAGLVVGYHVDDFDYHVAFTADGVRVRTGACEAATVTFRSDRATATAIARGELSAQRAFMAGRLRIRGDATALVRAQAAVATLDDVFGEIHRQTEW